VTAFEARLGIFARTFRRDTPAQVAAAVSAAGYPLAHWNFAAVGRPTLTTDPDAFDEVRAAFGDRIPSVSATFNAIHPDPGRRAAETAAATALIRLAPRLGADVVTICTGTRDADDMWRAHPGNAAPDAWSDLRRTLEVLLDAAREAGVVLGVEPEPGNVISDAPAAARLLGELGPDAPAGIVLDPANLLTPATVDRQGEILGEAVETLGPHVVGMQAKDVVTSGYSAAGAGLMDWPAALRLLAPVPPVPLIVQDADEGDAPRVRADLMRWSE
jgi:sugar phosphate isomerase/epimerase